MAAALSVTLHIGDLTKGKIQWDIVYIVYFEFGHLLNI